MRNVYEHVEERLRFIESIRKEWPDKKSRHDIVPKRFTVKKVSEVGRSYLGFRNGQKRKFDGLAVSERFTMPGRVFFFPEPMRNSRSSEIARFIEIKGYGTLGGNISLSLHDDGDILNGMFHKNADKEFDILQKASAAGLRVPEPLFTGKISKKEWLQSGLRVVDFCSGDKSPWNLELISRDMNELRSEVFKRMNNRFPIERNDMVDALAQPYNAGVLGRAPRSPLRVGDHLDKYKLTDENIDVARICGDTFFKLIDLGYLHLGPDTGNWTEAGELTDMADCYDLKKDKNLQSIISLRERKRKQGFWQNLIGPYHTSNLSRFFIEGMFGERVSLEDAAEELKRKTLNKIVELRN